MRTLVVSFLNCIDEKAWGGMSERRQSSTCTTDPPLAFHRKKFRFRSTPSDSAVHVEDEPTIITWYYFSLLVLIIRSINNLHQNGRIKPSKV
jgi:hypothetical protein